MSFIIVCCQVDMYLKIFESGIGMLNRLDLLFKYKFPFISIYLHYFRLIFTFVNEISLKVEEKIAKKNNSRDNKIEFFERMH